MKKTITMIMATAAILAVYATAGAQDGGPGMEPGKPGPEQLGPPSQGRPPMKPMPWKGDMGDGEMQETLLTRALENPELTKKLGLTEDQVKTLQNKFFEIKKKEIKLRSEQELAGLEQAKLLMDKVPNEKKLMDAIETAGKIQIEIAKLRMQRVLIVKTSLSDEQMMQVRKILREKMRDRMERGKMQPGGPNDQPMMGGGHDPEKIREHMRQMREKRQEFKENKDRVKAPPAPMAPDADEDDDDDDEAEND